MKKIAYILKTKSRVTDSEYKQIVKLRYSDGLMIPRYKSYDGYVILAKISKLIVGWGFCYFYPKDDIRIIYIFVHRDFRRNKIGTKIYQIAKKKFKEIQFYSHNLASREFFKSVKN